MVKMEITLRDALIHACEAKYQEEAHRDISNLPLTNEEFADVALSVIENWTAEEPA